MAKHARRVWYSKDIELLPRFTPEGLVRRVGDNWLSIVKKRTEALPTGDDHHRCEWSAETVFVDGKTEWTFQDLKMGTGTEILRHIARGFRVEVTYVNIDVYPRVAAAINVRSAARRRAGRRALARGLRAGLVAARQEHDL